MKKDLLSHVGKLGLGLELSTLFATLSNTVLATFWAVYRVYSDKQLLLDLTKELGVQVPDEESE